MATRSCVVCRKTEDQRRLLRFVADPVIGAGGLDEVTLRMDFSGVASGRGAYCHVTGACFLDARLLPLLKASLLRARSAKIARRAKRDGKGFAPLIEMLESAIARERDLRGRSWVHKDHGRAACEPSSTERKSFELVKMSRTKRVSVLLDMIRGHLEDSKSLDSSPKSKILLRL